MNRPLLADVLDVANLRAMVAGGYVAEKRHATLPLRIYDYTAKASYERVWNPETMACRGLVVDDDDAIVARPFAKFFNFGEHDPGTVPVDEPFEAFEKMDGSLGILLPHGAFSTRGSFASDQAVHATEVWRRSYADRVRVPDGQTWLFEIVYPENRVVVDYGGLDDLVLLAVIDDATGRDLPLPGPDAWPGPVVRRYDISDFASLLARVAEDPEDNREGFVIRFASGLRVKVKLPEYIRLHRIVTGVSTTTIWEHLSAGLPLEPLLERVPDEFFAWVRATVAELHGSYARVEEAARAAFADPRIDPLDRKRSADYITGLDSVNRAILWKLYDGRPFDPIIWRAIKPAFAKPFRVDMDA